METPGGTDWKARASELEHELLAARDTITGLSAELETLAARAELLESSAVGAAYARIDELEDQREALLHEVRWAILNQRTEVEKVKASVTWRIGSLVVRPLARLRGRARE